MDLIEGNTYEFRVLAENRVGRSDPSPVSTPVVIRDLTGTKYFLKFVLSFYRQFVNTRKKGHKISKKVNIRSTALK